MVLLQILCTFIILVNAEAQYSNCQQGFRCLPSGQCSARGSIFNSCSLSNGRQGVCCRNQQYQQIKQQLIIFPGQGENFRNPAPQSQSNYDQTSQIPSTGCGSSSACQQNNEACVPLILCQSAAANFINSDRPLRTCSLSDGSQGAVCPTTSGDEQGQQRFPSADRESSGQFSTSSVSSASTAFPISSSISPGTLLNIRASPSTIQAANDKIQGTIQSFQGPPPTVDEDTSSFFSPNVLQLLNHQSFNFSQVNQFGGIQNLQLLSQLVSGSTNNGGESIGSDTRFSSHSYIPPRQRPAAPSFQSVPTRDDTSAKFVLPNCTPLPIPSCPNAVFRTIDGTCNNLPNPNLGSALTSFKRYLPNTYEDGVYQFRERSVTGGSLPSARTISERIVDNELKKSPIFTIGVMQWGQFLDHDMDHQLLPRAASQRPIECCQDNGMVFPAQPLHPQCIPIRIDARDSFYSQFGQRCMSLVRTLPAPSPDCLPRSALPMNELTAYLDCSQVYGSQEAESAGIRLFRDGLLRTSRGNLLPLMETNSGEGNRCRGTICFMAGETRVNEQSGLAVMHTIFHREHNRVARELKRLKGPLDDETLFQMARKIVTAEWQHITYYEWLPLVIGFRYAYAHGIITNANSHSFDYNPRIDPRISTEFATAAFRFGHSLVVPTYNFIDANGRTIRTENLTSTFFNPELLVNYLNEHSRALVATHGEKFDKRVTRAIHGKLFTTDSRVGFDLVAFNIQRGRDHGIATYVDMLHACTGHRVIHWADLGNLISSENIDRLRSIYAHPADVDLFAGGLLERPAFQAIVGPTFQCLITQQFMELRYGDRFFYDNGGMPHSLSVQQLNEIRKTSWARIMCDNLRTSNHQDFDRVQPLAFLVADNMYNPIVHCDSIAIPRVDLRVF